MWLFVAVAAYSTVKIVAPNVALPQDRVETRVLPRRDFAWVDAFTPWSTRPSVAARIVACNAVYVRARAYLGVCTYARVFAYIGTRAYVHTRMRVRARTGTHAAPVSLPAPHTQLCY